MNLKTIRIDRRMPSAFFVLTILVAALGCARPAFAAWRNVDAQNAWQAYQNAFLHTEPDGYSKYFATEQGGTTPQGYAKAAF